MSNNSNKSTSPLLHSKKHALNSKLKTVMSAAALSLVCTLSACTQNTSKTAKASTSTPSVSTDSNSVLFARHVPERSDDFAWENDLVAFRAYGPALRQGAENAGTDCWLKRVNYPIINKWYQQALEQGLSYHQDHGEGLDNYHVGASLGCGASALWLKGKAEPLETWTHWSDLQIGQQQLSFVLHYQREINGKLYQEQKTISLRPGVRLFRVQSQFLIDGKPASNLALVTGLSTHYGKAEVKIGKDNNWLATWEELDGSGLGTGIVLGKNNSSEKPKAKALTQALTSDVNDPQALLLSQTDEHGRFEYFAGYGWQKAEQITNKEQWLNYLKQFSETNPYYPDSSTSD
ncbi:DUF4861 family protein [Agaribacterium sp. ZY112]|uniref:DUF4861 family protein n=1 Tax=Agaribacterium sp. ZY112 TaxID=3233574 RepID=UPI0035259279